jgi:hypothetical protein
MGQTPNCSESSFPINAGWAFFLEPRHETKFPRARNRKDALGRGMTPAEAAAFLCRGEDEVRRKAKQMKIPDGRLRVYTHYRLPRGR